MVAKYHLLPFLFFMPSTFSAVAILISEYPSIDSWNIRLTTVASFSLIDNNLVSLS